MRVLISLAGAFLAAILLLAIVDIYTVDRTMLDLPLLIIFFIVWAVGFGYATVEANLKKKIIAVLAIEGVALAGSAGYFTITRGFSSEYTFGLTLGVAAIIIMLLLRNKKEENS